MVSIADIASRASVSKSTAARVLSRSGAYSKAVEEKVRQAARELDWSPNAHARALRTRRTNLIGVVISTPMRRIIIHPFYGAVFEGIYAELRSREYGPLIITENQVDPAPVDWLTEHRIDGVVLVAYIARATIEYFRTRSVPYVLINPSALDEHGPCVLNDDYGGAYAATEHLIGRGYRRIAFVSGPVERQTGRNRWEAYQRALHDHGRAVLADHTFFRDSTVETGTAAARRFLDLADRPDAIFAANDMTAIGVLRELYARRLRVPEDVAVMGFGDIHYAQLTTPALSSVAIDKSELGATAVAKLAAMIRSGERDAERIVVPARLAIREST